MSAEPLILYYAPQSRAIGTRILLEELGVPYQLQVLNLKAGEQRKSDYLAVNPMGKVPAIRHRGAVVTEQVAIFLYLADAFPQADLAPGLDEILRGPYLRWMVFYAASFEPAVTDKALERAPGRPGMMAYGDYDTMLKTLTEQLSQGPYLLGKRFTAADILWGTALRWTTIFKSVPELPVIMDYVKRICDRPSVQKIWALDRELASAHEKQAQEKVA